MNHTPPPNGNVPVNSTGIGTARRTGAFNAKAVSGHSDTNHTACPGEHLRALLPQLNERVGQLLAGKAPGKAKDAPANADAARDRDRVAPPIAVGPLASPTEVLARDLRSVGLLSLADHISPAQQAP